MMAVQATRILTKPENIIGLATSGSWATTTMTSTNEVTTWYSGPSFAFASYDMKMGTSIVSLQSTESTWSSSGQVFGVTGSASVSSVNVPQNLILTKVVLPEIVGLAGFAAASLGLFVYSLTNYGAASALPFLGTFAGTVIGLGAVVRLSKMSL
jgi:hypothetical protein